MREVRMTFGEHLEDLRRRIFMALLWLALGVAICFVYGKALLKWTMGPHGIAIKGAMRDRSISLLEAKGRELISLIGEGAGGNGSEAGTRTGAAPAPGWEQLFAGEIRRSRLRISLEEFARQRVLPLVEGRVEAAKLSELVEEFARALENSLSNEAGSLSARSLPERFALLEDELRQTRTRTGE